MAASVESLRAGEGDGLPEDHRASFGGKMLDREASLRSEDGEHAETMSRLAELEPPNAISEVATNIWPGNPQSEIAWPPNDTLLHLKLLNDWATWPIARLDQPPADR